MEELNLILNLILLRINGFLHVAKMAGYTLQNISKKFFFKKVDLLIEQCKMGIRSSSNNLGRNVESFDILVLSEEKSAQSEN